MAIAVTSGEPAGIGPDLMVHLAHSPEAANLWVLGDPSVLRARADALGQSITLIELDTQHPSAPSKPWKAGQLYCLPIQTHAPVLAGQLNSANAPYVLETLNCAHRLVSDRLVSAMVTAPIHKGIINQAGIPFSGHTEWFQALSGVDAVVMMLATPGLRMALATTHLPLRQVADSLDAHGLSRVLEILHASLVQDFAIADPIIRVAGLNPHAGEDGHLGHEEIEFINPVIQKMQQRGWQVFGSYPADTLFTPKWLENTDAFLAMYHDQGLPVLKHKGFGQAVNITLGLPYIRTSVDHGTALELAGTGQASASSLHYAIQIAHTMSQHRNGLNR
jgi:4-hydroxythreonine-4-phosphate dehydrogenase